jgi:hypothetical protein
MLIAIIRIKEIKASQINNLEDIFAYLDALVKRFDPGLAQASLTSHFQ